MSLAPAPSVGIGASSTNGGGGSGAAAAAVTAAVVVAAAGDGGGGGAPGLCWTTAWYCLERKPMPPGLFDCVMEAPRLCGRGEPADAAPGDRFQLVQIYFEQKNDIFLPIINMISGCFSRKKSALQATPGTGKAKMNCTNEYE